MNGQMPGRDVPHDGGTRIGIFMSNDFAEEFRKGCQKRGYKQSALVRIALEEQFLKQWRAEDAQREPAA